MPEQQIGWNYENLVLGGRNIYIFRDTNHYSQSVREQLFEEMDLMVENGLNLIFCEGGYGHFIPDYKYLESKKNKSVLGRLSCKRRKEIDSGKLVIYGIDNENSLAEQKKLLRELSQLEETVDYDHPKIKSIQNELELLSGSREVFCAMMIDGITDMRKIKKAGLIFGDGHYTEIYKMLRTLGIGYASYFPGESEPTEEEIKEFRDAIRA